MFSKKYFKQSILSFVVSALFFTSVLFAQSNNSSDVPISEDHYNLLETRRELIEKENSNSENEWVGAYQFGDHHPTIFVWSANQGFITWGSHHTFSPSRLNFGKAEFTNNRLVIKPEIPQDHLNFQYIPVELVTVKWGEQHFLVSPDRLIDFAYAAHSGSELQITEFLSKSKDYQKSRNGLPNLPKEYNEILAMKAIKPKIKSVKANAEDIFDSEIILDSGRLNKIIKGMIFYYADSLGSLRIMVTDVSDRESKAKVVGIMGNGKNDKTPELKTGLKFTSKLPKGFDEI